MKRIIQIILVLAVIGCVALFMVLQSNKDTARRHQASPIPDVSKVEYASLNSPGYTDSQSEAGRTEAVRKIIQRGEISMQVQEYEKFFRALQNELERTGGYIGELQAYRTNGALSSARIVVRIPSDDTGSFTSWLREKGKITAENITADDVSEEYYDLQARLTNARKFEARLHEMIQKSSGSLEDLVLLEEKLSAKREEIEQMEGRIRLLDRLASLATLTLNVQVENSVAPPAAPGFSARALQVWKNSIDVLKEAAQGAALLVIAFTPWILPLLIIAILIRILYRASVKVVSLRLNRRAES